MLVFAVTDQNIENQIVEQSQILYLIFFICSFASLQHVIYIPVTLYCSCSIDFAFEYYLPV